MPAPRARTTVALSTLACATCFLIRSTLRYEQQKAGATPSSLFPENPAVFPETKLKGCSARPLYTQESIKMKKVFLALVTVAIALVATFFLNSDFKSFVINVGASNNTEEVLYQLGKDTPPVINITHSLPSFEKNDEIILNNYILMIVNPNNQDSAYELKIDNKKFSHSIKTDIHVASHKTKKIPFHIYTPIKNNTNTRDIEELEISVVDKNNPTLITKEQVGFILKSI